MNDLNLQTGQILARVRQQRPLVHHITNFVVMNDTANVTLHIGALPVMAHAAEEVADMVRLAGALVLNPGTLTPDWVESMLIAGRAANERGIPIVLDPVGAGATPLRTEANRRLLGELQVTVVRGNAGEIGALVGAGGEVKGVESVGALDDPVAVARRAAREWGATVAMTGEHDIVTDGQRVMVVENGHRWLTTITGTGCMATTTVAAFAAVEPDPVVAAACALAYYGRAAELAAEEAKGPASFKVAFFDWLYNMTPEQAEQGARIRVESA